MVNLFPSGHIYRKHYNNKYYLVICQSLISYKSANILYGHEPYLLSPDIALLTTSLQVSKIWTSLERQRSLLHLTQSMWIPTNDPN